MVRGEAIEWLPSDISIVKRWLANCEKYRFFWNSTMLPRTSSVMSRDRGFGGKPPSVLNIHILFWMTTSDYIFYMEVEFQSKVTTQFLTSFQAKNTVSDQSSPIGNRDFSRVIGYRVVTLSWKTFSWLGKNFKNLWASPPWNRLIVKKFTFIRYPHGFRSKLGDR